MPAFDGNGASASVGGKAAWVCLAAAALSAAALSAAVHVVAADADEVAPQGGAACKSDVDCQLNGLCTRGACVCDAAWKGANCSALNLLPAKMANGFGHPHSNTSSWGGGVVFDATTGAWVMFASQMNNGCGLGTWGTNSRCVLAASDTPNGPYTQTRVVMDSWCHGATPGRDPKTGTWLFNHMGSGRPKGKGGTCALCANGTTPRGAKQGACATGGPGTVDTPSALTSPSPDGPYTARPRMTNGANCEPFFHPNGTLYMACPSGGTTTAPNCNNKNAFLHMSKAASMADAMAGRYEAMEVKVALGGTGEDFVSPPAICFNWEDQNLWIDKRGNFHTLMHAYRGQPCDYPVCDRVHNEAFCTAVGGHAYSADGFNWYISPVVAYTPTVTWEDGSSVTYRARERPHLIFDPKTGDMTHFVNGVGDPGCGGNTGCPGQDHTFTIVVPLGTAP